MKHISRGKGRSATAAAAYRSGIRINDDRTGNIHDYRAKHGVLHSSILAPSRAPDWARDPETLWNQVEQDENRNDSRVARENIVALPHELTLEQNTNWLHAFVNDNYVKRGMVAHVCIHEPDHSGDNRNYHAHIMLSPRQITRNGFKKTKPREWNNVSTLNRWREAFAEYQNRALERNGHDERVDHRSFRSRGIDREPTQHVGPAANKIERDDHESDIGQRNRLTREFNQNLQKMKEFKDQIEEQMERERKQIELHKRLDQKVEALQKDDHEGRRIPNDPFGDLARHDREQKLSSRHSRERADLDDENNALYKCKEKERIVREAKGILERKDNLWGRLTGGKARAEKHLNVAELNLQNAQMREKERITALTQRHEKERLEVLGPKPQVKAREDFNREVFTQPKAKEKSKDKTDQIQENMPAIQLAPPSLAENDNEQSAGIQNEFNRKSLDRPGNRDLENVVREKMRNRRERREDKDRGR